MNCITIILVTFSALFINISPCFGYYKLLGSCRTLGNSHFQKRHRILFSVDSNSKVFKNAISEKDITDQFHIIDWIDKKQKIRHRELYLKSLYGGPLWSSDILRFMPSFIKPKPSAKVGVRDYTSTSDSMEVVISELFPVGSTTSSSLSAETTSPIIGLFVYMVR